VANRVLEQIRDQPDQQPPVARHDSRDQLDVEIETIGVGLVLAQRVLDDHGKVDQLMVVDSLLALGEREQCVDQLFLLLVLLERVATRLPERLTCGVRVGDHHLEQRARGGQRRAQLVRRIGHEPPLRVVGLLERTQHPPRDEPAQSSRDQRHDGQRDRGLDLKMMQIGDPLASASELHGGLAGRRLQHTPDRGRQYLRRRVRLGPGRGDVVQRTRPICLREDAGRIRGQRGVRDEPVGDGQQRGAAGQEQPAVEQGQSPSHGGLRVTKPAHLPSPIL
jgi:hypothetical protein